MAGAFNLTAQINLQGPGNIKPVVSKIRKELGSIKTNVNLNLNKNSAKAVGDVTNRLRAMNNVLATSRNHVMDLNKSFRDLSASLAAVRSDSAAVSSGVSNISKGAGTSAKQIKEAANAMESFGKQSFLAIKRFAAFSLVTSGVYGLVNAIQSGFTAFIELDRQLIRLQQTTGSGALGIKALSDEITNLASSLGVSSASLAEVAVTLAQAGLTANQTKEALTAIAKTDLAPSFTNMAQTTEGVIAAFRQFNLSTSDLESVLGSVNAVAAGFAVEADDIIAAIQRTGGVFASASQGVSQGKDALNEFIAVFTSVRATTRESAETIATGLRTIFTRIQRESTIKALEELGIKLRDNEGQFVGAFEAVRRLSEGLKSIDPRSREFASISEELGGFRQIGKVIPLIQQFGTAQQALDVARKGSNSLAQAQAVAEQSLAVQIAKVREEFLGLIKAVGQSQSFQAFFGLVTKLTGGLIKLAGVFKPILPLLTILGTLKIGKAAIDFGTGFTKAFSGGGGTGAAGSTLGQTLTGTDTKDKEAVRAMAAEATRNNTTAINTLTNSIATLTTSVNNLAEEIATSPGFTTKNAGGKVLAFARGGVVPGTGNRDTVPAMLQPGEFVIRKKAVETLGTDQLHSMNKYAKGGKAYYGAKQRKVPFEAGVGPSPFDIPKQKTDYYSLESGSGFKAGEFDMLVQYAKTNAFNLEEFAAYIQKRQQQKLRKYLDGGIVKKLTSGEKVTNRELTQFYSEYFAENPDLDTATKDKIVRIRSIGASKEGSPKKNQAIEFAKELLSRGSQSSIQSKILDNIQTSTEMISALKPGTKPRSLTAQTVALKGSYGEQTPRTESYTEGETALQIKRFVANETFANDIIGQINASIEQLLKDMVERIEKETKTPIDSTAKQKYIATAMGTGIDTIIGDLFEKSLIASGAPLGPKQIGSAARPVDLKSLGPNNLEKLFTDLEGNNPDPNLFTEVKKQMDRTQSTAIRDKLSRLLAAYEGPGGIASRYRNGGSIQDTVPALLTPGEFVINKKAASSIGSATLNRLNKADKIQGYNSGGYVGIQKFARGDTVLPAGPLLAGGRDLPNDPAGAKARAKAEEILADAATRAGKSLQQLENETRKQIVVLAQLKTKERQESRSALKTQTLRATGRGFADQGEREKFEAQTRSSLTTLGANRFDETQIGAAASAAADMAAAGKTFSEIMNDTNPVLQAFQISMNDNEDSIIALNQAQLEMADSLGALTESARSTAEELARAEYLASGQAQKTLGLAGRISPDVAKSLEGSTALSGAQSVLGGGFLGNQLVKAIGALPEGIGKPLQTAIDNIGGPSGAIAAGIGMIGQTLPGILKSVGLGSSVLGAGIGGALETGGSRAVSMATLGTQLAGPLGGAIGLITGALSGAIDGFINAARTKKLEQSMAALDKATTTATQSLETLSKVDNERNVVAAAKATDTLRDSIKDLGDQAQTGGTSILGGAISGAGYGAIAGLFVGSFLGPLGAAIGAGIGGAAGAIAGGITSYFSSDEISEEAFKSQLKAVETYINGIQQLAERRINLQSLETLDKTLNAFKNAQTPEQRAALASSGSIVGEAQRAALLRESIKIGANEDVGTFLRSPQGTARGTSGQNARDIAESTKVELARSYAIQELNRQFAGNKELIDKEIANEKKLTKRGLELIAIEEERFKTQAQLDAILREVNNQTESLIEQFRKMDAIINKFNDSLEMTEAIIDSTISAVAGQATSTLDLRAGQRILANPTAASEADFTAVLNRIEQLAGGGENARQLTQTIQAQRTVQLKLPELLRGASKENVGKVVDQLENVFKAGGISGPALENAVKQVRDSLSGQVEGRQGKGFAELIDEFPTLAAAMRSFETAISTGKNILDNNSNTLKRYGNTIDQINDSIRRQIDIEQKADQIRLDYAAKIQEITGRISDIRLDEPVRNKVTALTTRSGIGATLDPTVIGTALRKAISERTRIEEQRRDPQQADNEALVAAYAEQTNIVNNLTEALNELAENTETTAQIMKEFEKVDRVLNTTFDFAKEVLTQGPEELAQTAREQRSLSAFLTDPKYREALRRPEMVQERRNVFAGFESIRGVLDPAQAKQIERQLITEMRPELLEMKIGDKTYKELLDESDQKAKDLKAEEDKRIAALKEQQLAEAALQTDLIKKQEELRSAIVNLTNELKNGIVIRPATTSAASTANSGAATEATARNVERVSVPTAKIVNPVEVASFRKSLGQLNSMPLSVIETSLDRLEKEYKAKFGEMIVTDSGDYAPDSLKGRQTMLYNDLAAKEKAAKEGRIETPTEELDRLFQEFTAGAEARAMARSQQASAAAASTIPAQNNPLQIPPTLAAMAQVGNVAPIDQNVIVGNLINQLYANPLPVKVVNISELKNNNGETQTSYNMFTTTEAKAFLSDFTNTISSFKSYIDNLQKIMNVPVKIDVVGRHTVDVRITGAAAFESLKGDFTNLIINEIDKKFQQIWARSGGQLGSSGASARSVQPQQF